MKFYIASSFQNKDLVKYVSIKLCAKGYSPTYDWTINQRATTISQLQRIGAFEKNAIEACDIFILLLPAGRGSHVELGMAIALNKQVYIYTAEEIDPATASTFYYVNGVEQVYGEIDKLIGRIGLV